MTTTSTPFDADRMAKLGMKIAADAGPLVLRAHRIESQTGIQPTAYVLPLSWDPGPHPEVRLRSADESDRAAYLFGRPVMWDPQDRMGLYYEVPQS